MKLQISILLILLSGALILGWSSITKGLSAISNYYSAYQGDADSQYRLAQSYLHKGSNDAVLKALALLEDAAEQDHEQSMYVLVDIYGKQQYGVPRNLEKAFYFAKKSAQFNKPVALYVLGLAYSTGAGTSEDPVQALYWFQKAADGGYPAGMYEAGIGYMEGRGAPLDYEKARFYFEKSADSYPQSLYALATLYRFGYGVEKDPHKSQEYLEKSARMGVPEAAYSYARYLDENGQGHNDWMKAGEMYALAKHQNIAYAESVFKHYKFVCTTYRAHTRDISEDQKGFLKACMIALADNDPVALDTIGQYYFAKGDAQGLTLLDQAARLAYVPSIVSLIQMNYAPNTARHNACLSYSWAMVLEKLMNAGTRKIEVISRDEFSVLKTAIYDALTPDELEKCSANGEALFRSLSYDAKMVY